MSATGREAAATAPPFVTLAVFCERAEQHADGTLSIHKVLDTFTALPPQPGEAHPSLRVFAVVTLLTSAPFGPHELTLTAQAPGGERAQIASFTIETSHGNAYVGRFIPVEMQFAAAGDYWFDVTWDARVVTRMRLAVSFQNPQ